MLLPKILSLLYAKFYNFIIINSFDFNFEKYPSINGKLVLKGNGRFEIGCNVIINSSIQCSPVGLATATIFFAYQQSTISIGNNVGISNSLLCAMIGIVIEDDVTIGGGTQILDSDFHSIQYSNRMKSPDNAINSKPVLVRKGAFIGCNTIILKGVTIGERSVIAAGSVVTKSVPNDEIWGGNPAVFLRKIIQMSVSC